MAKEKKVEEKVKLLSKDGKETIECLKSSESFFLERGYVAKGTKPADETGKGNTPPAA